MPRTESPATQRPAGSGLGPTTATADQVTFRLADTGPQAARVWLDLDHHGEPPAMTPVPGGFELTIPRPPVARLEYLFTVRYPDGGEAMITEPGAPRAAGAFGDHSVVFFPGYAEPAWLSAPAPDGTVRELGVVPAPPGVWLDRPVPVTLWTPAGTAAGSPLPLLLLHDGPEYDRYASVLRFCAAGIAAGWLPRHRVALLGPGDRNRWYAASPEYARTLTRGVVPYLRREAPAAGPLALGGASLGGLAALHAAWLDPGTFGGLFLQSGSFFRPHTDDAEAGYGGFGAITSFVRGIAAAPPPARLDVSMTCGLGEENLANNRLMAGELAALGHRVELAEVPDAHTFTGWRDALDPCLSGLLGRLWAPGSGQVTAGQASGGQLTGGQPEGTASAAQPA